MLFRSECGPGRYYPFRKGQSDERGPTPMQGRGVAYGATGSAKNLFGAAGKHENQFIVHHPAFF